MFGGKSRDTRVRQKRTLKRLNQVRTWQLLLILVLLVFVAATFLRLNNIGMVQRRDAVLSADAEGDHEVMQSRLYDLQRYASDHMNASTGPIYLQESYNRDWEVRREAASSQGGRQNIYNHVAKEICEPRAIQNGWGSYSMQYHNCLLTELAKYPEGDQLISSVDPPNESLYRHSFVSPNWSPDFAGFSVLLCLLLTLVIVGRFVGILILRALLHRHYQDA